jgi:long-chain acyl-CoA synthetase
MPDHILSTLCVRLGIDELITSKRRLRRGKFREKEVVLNENPVAFYLLSSGTTGEPKLVARSCESILAQSSFLSRRLGIGRNSRVQSNAPFFHSFGVEGGLIVTVLSGGLVVSPAERSFGISSIAFIDEMGVTHILGNPALVKLLVAYKGENSEGLKKLERVISGGAAIDGGLYLEFSKLFSCPLTSLYGLSELGCVSISEDGVEIRNGYVGTPIDGCRIKVVDGDGNELSDGMVGTIMVKKGSLELGYLSEELNRVSFIDGWFRTNDLGYFKNGSIYLTGSRSAFVNIGGKRLTWDLLRWR